MAEDSSSEADALRVVFPHSTQLLSTYHVLKSAWKWFFGHRKSHVQKKKKPYMFSLLKRLVVSTCPEEIDHFEKIISSEYPSVTTYVAYLYAKKELWGLCFRGNYPLYSNYIFNYVDFEMGALNERVLSGINNLNIIELFDLILSKVETYYRGKITGESNLQDQTSDVSISIPMSDVNRVEERIFVVKCQFSSLRHFVVNTDLNMCTCFAGFNGGFCEHQSAVQKYFGDSFDQIAKFTCLATGKHFQDSWYHFLQLEEVAKSYEVMEAYTAETNDLGEDEDSEDDVVPDDSDCKEDIDFDDKKITASSRKQQNNHKRPNISNQNHNSSSNSKSRVKTRPKGDFVVADSTKSSKDTRKTRLQVSFQNQNNRERRKKIKEEETMDDESTDEEMSEWNENGDSSDNEFVTSGMDIKIEEDDEEVVDAGPEVFNRDHTVKRIREVCTILEKHVTEKPDIFIPPVNDFLSNLLSPKTDRQLVSMLLSFGKENS